MPQGQQRGLNEVPVIFLLNKLATWLQKIPTLQSGDFDIADELYIIASKPNY